MDRPAGFWVFHLANGGDSLVVALGYRELPLPPDFKGAGPIISRVMSMEDVRCMYGDRVRDQLRDKPTHVTIPVPGCFVDGGEVGVYGRASP